MKKKILFFFTVVLFTFTFSSNTFSQIFDENFDYTNNELISDYVWVPFSGIGINPIKVVEPGLEYPCYGCVFGNAAKLTSTGEDVYKFLNTTINTGDAYISFMVKIDSAQTGDMFFHLGDSTLNNQVRVAQVYAKKSGSDIAFGFAKEGNNNEVYTPAVYSTDVVYLLVVKYSFIAGEGNDEASLFIFTPPDCAPSIEPAATLGPYSDGDDAPNLGKVVLQQGAEPKGPYLVIDGICGDNIWNNGALPIELSSFSSAINRNDVTLNWATVSEINNAGFDIERKSGGSDIWKTIGNVSGMGTSSISHRYNFTDKNLSSGNYSYRLKQIDFNGEYEYFNLNSEVGIGVPVKFELSQNYPNPFNPSTKIDFDLPRDGFTSLKVFDNSGKEVAVLVNDIISAGYHTVTFDASNLSSGIYYYKFETNGMSKVMKMALVK